MEVRAKKIRFLKIFLLNATALHFAVAERERRERWERHVLSEETLAGKLQANFFVRSRWFLKVSVHWSVCALYPPKRIFNLDIRTKVCVVNKSVVKHRLLIG